MKTKRSNSLTSLVALTLIALSACDSRASQPIIAEFGDQKVTTEDFYLYLEQLNPRMEYAELPATEQARLLDEYVTHRVFAEKARDQGLDRQTNVAARLEFFERRVLAEAFREQVARNIKISDSDVEAYYEKNKPLFAVPAKYLIEHLVYKEPDKAIYAQAQLREGRPYLELAKHRESDADLTFVERNSFAADILLPELRGPVSELEVGAVTELVYTNYGYHVIRLVEKEDATYRTLDEVRDEIAARLQQAAAGRQLKALVEEGMTQGNVKIHLDSLRSAGSL